MGSALLLVFNELGREDLLRPLRYLGQIEWGSRGPHSVRNWCIRQFRFILRLSLDNFLLCVSLSPVVALIFPFRTPLPLYLHCRAELTSTRLILESRLALYQQRHHCRKCLRICPLQPYRGLRWSRRRGGC